jgi:hypothetical protein
MAPDSQCFNVINFQPFIFTNSKIQTYIVPNSDYLTVNEFEPSEVVKFLCNPVCKCLLQSFNGPERVYFHSTLKTSSLKILIREPLENMFARFFFACLINLKKSRVLSALTQTVTWY